MSFDILNPGGRDPDQSFSNDAGSPRDTGHPPVNYHGYAACMRGYFRRKSSNCESKYSLLLLRKRNLRDALRALRDLKARGVKVLVSCKESGSHQVAEFLDDPKRWIFFCEICRAADGALSSTPELTGLYLSAGAHISEFIPTPYPLEAQAWDFSKPLQSRSGIFIGTREFDVPSRNHMAAIMMANCLSRELLCHVSVVNGGGRHSKAMLAQLQKTNPQLRLLNPMSYTAYLEEMAGHRLVWQLDSSAVPGQVAGDALLCRMPCLGGNGAVDRLAFPDLSSPVSREALMEKARTLMVDDGTWQNVAESALKSANDELSFSAVGKKLEALFCRLDNRRS